VLRSSCAARGIEANAVHSYRDGRRYSADKGVIEDRDPFRFWTGRRRIGIKDYVICRT